MRTIILAGMGLAAVHVVLAQGGHADAALWLTAGIGCFGLICFGVARA